MAEPALLDSGQWLGDYALALFFAGLFGVPIIAGLLAWSIRRSAWTHAVLIRLGVLLIAMSVSLFLTIVGIFGINNQQPGFDQSFSTAVGLNLSFFALQTFFRLTDLGDPWLLTFLCIALGIVLIVRREYIFACGWVIAIVGNGILNRVLKAIYERTRPVHEHLLSAHGWSFPSGHTSGAMVTYGMLAYLAIHFLPRKWHVMVIMLAATLIFTIGCSRIFLQAHFLSDVLAGLASGTAWLTLCIAVTELLRKRYRSGARDLNSQA
jgi:membrane-associated phospholipid phosphatase